MRTKCVCASSVAMIQLLVVHSLNAHASESPPIPVVDKPMDLNAYCQKHGYSGVTNSDNTGYGWKCQPGDANIDAQQLCHEQYGVAAQGVLLTPPPGGRNDWVCRVPNERISAFIVEPLMAAQKALQAQNLDEALADINRAQRADGERSDFDNYIINVLLFQTYQKKQDAVHAVATLTALAHSPIPSPQYRGGLLSNIADYYLREKNYAQAIDFAQQALALGNDNSYTRQIIANATAAQASSPAPTRSFGGPPGTGAPSTSSMSAGNANSSSGSTGTGGTGGNALAGASVTGGSNPTCPTSAAYLADRLPSYPNNAQLTGLRNQVLSQNFQQMWQQLLSQGFTPASALTGTVKQMQQAQLQEVGARRVMAQYSGSNPDAVIAALQNGTGSVPDDLQSTNATGAGAIAYVAAYYLNVMMGETLKAFKCIANSP